MQAWEAGKIGIARAKFGVLLNGERGEMVPAG